MPFFVEMSWQALPALTFPEQNVGPARNGIACAVKYQRWRQIHTLSTGEVLPIDLDLLVPSVDGGVDDRIIENHYIWRR